MSAPLIPTETVTRVRRAAGSVDASGQWATGAETSSSILASVQPLDERDLETLPEGERQKDWRKVYAPRNSFRTASQHDGSDADLVVIDGARYQVRHVESERALIPHDKALVARLREAT